MSERQLKVLWCGDVVGRPGRRALARELPKLREAHQVHLVIANGENAAGGMGLDSSCALELRSAGVDLITLGDHAFQRADIRPFLDANAGWVIRPANYPGGAPGVGSVVREVTDSHGQTVTVGVANLIGRVFMNGSFDCPYLMMDALLAGPYGRADVRLCDFHAEATSEKYLMARRTQGKLHGLVGTHTHVQTSDAQVLPGGTAYVSDLGMCGPHEGVIGMDADVAGVRLVRGLPAQYKVARGLTSVQGVVITIDTHRKEATAIELIRVQSVSDDSAA